MTQLFDYRRRESCGDRQDKRETTAFLTVAPSHHAYVLVVCLRRFFASASASASSASAASASCLSLSASAAAPVGRSRSRCHAPTASCRRPPLPAHTLTAISTPIRKSWDPSVFLPTMQNKVITVFQTANQHPLGSCTEAKLQAKIMCIVFLGLRRMWKKFGLNK